MYSIVFCRQIIFKLNIAKRTGDKFLPCLTPILQWNTSDKWFPTFIQDLAASYML